VQMERENKPLVQNLPLLIGTITRSISMGAIGAIASPPPRTDLGGFFRLTSFFKITFLFQIIFNMSRVCSTSNILGTNGLNSADVPLSNKQTNTFFRLNI